MTQHRVGINAGDIFNLQSVIEYYEANNPEQNKHNITNSWRPIENVNASLSSSIQSLGIAGDIKKGWDEFKKPFADANTAYKNETNKINKGIADLYAPGASVKREKVVEVGPLKIKISGTIAALQDNDATTEQKLSAILQDCLPCDWRVPEHQLLPDFSFLDQIIQAVTDFIASIQALIESLVSQEKTSTDLCITLNLINFTCVPDMNALALLLAKSIPLSLKLPDISIPGLGMLAAAILLPFFMTLVNLIMAWINFIIKPVECIIASLKSVITKLGKFEGKKIAGNMKIDGSLSGLKTTYNDKEIYKGLDLKGSLPASQGMKNFFNSLDTTASVEKAIKGLDEITKFITGIRDKIKSVMDGILQKCNSLMNQANKQIAGLQKSIQEVMRIISLITLINLLTKLFNQEVKMCGKSKEEAFATMQHITPGIIAAKEPNNFATVDQSGNPLAGEVIKRLAISSEEFHALGFENMSGVRITSIVGPSPDKTLFDIKSVITLEDCLVPFVHREQFVSVNEIIDRM